MSVRLFASTPSLLPRRLFNFSSNILLIKQTQRSATMPVLQEWYKCAQLAKPPRQYYCFERMPSCSGRSDSCSMRYITLDTDALLCYRSRLWLWNGRMQCKTGTHWCGFYASFVWFVVNNQSRHIEGSVLRDRCVKRAYACLSLSSSMLITLTNHEW